MIMSISLSGNIQGRELTEPPRACGRRGDLDIREGALSHGRGVNDTLQFLVEANRVGVHVLVGATGDLDLIIDCAPVRGSVIHPQKPWRGADVPVTMSGLWVNPRSHCAASVVFHGS